MSSIAFHTIGHTTRVSGAERARMGLLIGNLTEVLLGFHRGDAFACDHAEVLRPVVVSPPMPPVHDREATSPERNLNWDLWAKWSNSFLLRFAHGGSFGAEIQWRDHRIDCFELQLNSVASVGGDALRLITRLHGACEIHTWAAEEDRAWLAGIIEDALKVGVLRSETRGYDGWSGVMAHLLDVSAHPGIVVTSYSVTDSFPNARFAGAQSGAEDAEDHDWFYELSEEEQWRRCEPSLRQSADQMKPENWQTFYFGKGVTVADLLASDRDERLSAKLL